MLASLLVLASLLLGLGCAGRPSILPNREKALRKTSTQFAADAAKRHPYQSDVPHGGEAVARAEVDYMLNELVVANLSNQDWQDVELWLNQKYVVHVPKVIHGTQVNLPFQMLYDDAGNYVPTNKLMKTAKLEAKINGKFYDIPVRLAD
ncbi:MAG: hypothetical protein H0U59_06180 [Gemmatimonadaceae bacterium]|nr:hypothetical protein [Gemmatimonadaceae bacterium]